MKNLKKHSTYRGNKLYTLAVLLYAAFFILVGVFENVSVYSWRTDDGYTVVDDYKTATVYDDTAPAGIKKLCTWIMKDVGVGGNYLCFYAIHQSVNIYIAGNIIYSLAPSPGNRLTGTVASNWVQVPLRLGDNGKELQVELIPHLKDYEDYVPEFKVGSRYAILAEQLQADMPQIFLSVICILIGVTVIVTQLYQKHKGIIRYYDVMYLGFMPLGMGLWRLSDLRSSPLIFSGNPVLLGYFALGMVILSIPPLIIYVHRHYYNNRHPVLEGATILSSVLAIVLLVLQMSGVLEMRRTLPVIHGTMLLGIILLMTVVLSRSRPPCRKVRYFRFLLVFIGVLADMLLFYDTGGRGGMCYTMSAFILVALLSFLSVIIEANRRANYDSSTGLYNKQRWKELLNNVDPSAESVAVAVFDLNGLKHVNDTQGHDAGDALIWSFADILRITVPEGGFICRWGGDEFAACVRGTDEEKVQRQLELLRENVQEHNKTPGEISISYAVGYAISSQHKDCDMDELFRMADEAMYADKQEKKTSETD